MTHTGDNTHFCATACTNTTLKSLWLHWLAGCVLPFHRAPRWCLPVRNCCVATSTHPQTLLLTAPPFSSLLFGNVTHRHQEVQGARQLGCFLEGGYLQLDGNRCRCLLMQADPLWLLHTSPPSLSCVLARVLLRSLCKPPPLCFVLVGNKWFAGRSSAAFVYQQYRHSLATITILFCTTKPAVPPQRLAPGYTENSRSREKMTYTMSMMRMQPIQNSKYEYFHVSSGMTSKFMPYKPATQQTDATMLSWLGLVGYSNCCVTGTGCGV